MEREVSEKENPDRVTYSFGMKINMGNYQSADFHVGLSTDVKEGETRDKAFARAKKYIDTRVEEEMNEIEKLRKDS